MSKQGIDTSAIDRAVLEQLLPKLVQAVEAEGANAAALMTLRIQEGRGLDDQAMKPYSKSHAKNRTKKGRQTDRRDLSMSGQMVGGIHSTQAEIVGDEIRTSVTIAGARNRELATYHQKREPFFGYSPRDEATIVSSLQKRVTEILRTAT